MIYNCDNDDNIHNHYVIFKDNEMITLLIDTNNHINDDTVNSGIINDENNNNTNNDVQRFSEIYI